MTSQVPTSTDYPATGTDRPIRVLYVIDTIFSMGGAELALFRLVQQLEGKGFRCTVVTFHTNERARPFREQFPCPVHWWELQSTYSLEALRVARKLRRLVREQDIDIVHTFFQSADLWAGPMAKLFGAKVLISSRRDMGILRHLKHKIGYRLLRGCFDQVQAVAEAVREFTIRTDGVDAKRVVTIHNGIESSVGVSQEELVRLRAACNLKPGVPVIVCVANFRPVKAVDVLVRALALVNGRNRNWQMVVVGGMGGSAVDVAYGEEVLALCRSLRVDGQILFAGYSENVAAYLELGDIFAMPSRSEGLSNALLEAMRTGLPCVATAVGGNPEVVVEGVTGFLVPPDDPSAFAERLLDLLGDPALRSAMARRARARLLDRFTVGAMATRIRAEYNSLLAAKQR